MASIPSDNIFNISDPTTWYCKIVEFQPVEHHILKFRLSHPTDPLSPFYVQFRQVIFYSGWMSWKGANFRIGTDDELVKFVLTTTSSYDNESLESLLDMSKFGNYRLFSCLGENNTPIHIVANAAWSSDKEGLTLVVPQ